MKIIELLNKIANGEEIPQMVSYKGEKYYIDELEHFYRNKDRKALLEYIFDYLNDFDALMTEIEIIEEDKKIEKIGYLNYCENPVESILHKKIDELIEVINEKL